LGPPTAIPTPGVSTVAGLPSTLIAVGNNWSPYDETYPGRQPLKNGALTDEPYLAYHPLKQGALSNESYLACQSLKKVH
jgi:hypothetical protein